MKNKKGLRIQLGILMIVAILAAIYITITVYYQDSFMLGTYVNGIYCTGKSIEEVNHDLVNLFEEKELVIIDAKGKEYKIPLADISYELDYYGQLQNMKKMQSPILWIQSLAQSESNQISPVIHFDRDQLLVAVKNSGILEENQKMNDVWIKWDNGYVLYDGMKDVLDIDKVISCLEEELYRVNTTIDITDCYSNLPYTAEMMDTFSLWEKIEDFQRCDIIYDMGDEQLRLSPEIVSKWITLDDDGDFLLDETDHLILNEDAVASFIDTLCETYDTFAKKRFFHSTSGEIVEIEGGTYGNKLDRDKEITYLVEAFQEKKQEVHVPAYEKQAFVRGKNDIGNTYVEIDMGLQKLYYYENDELLLETDIVTGNMRRRMGTPSGVFFVYSMQKNRTLRGEDYSAFVKYWAAVKGSVGIHDASWREEFGGEIYKTNGSHGCINVPRDKMTELYDMLDIGVPVVMFY